MLERSVKPSHLAFPLAHRFVGDFGSVVLVGRGAARDVPYHGAVDKGIAAQLVRHESSEFPTLPSKQFMEEAFGGPLIAPRRQTTWT